MERRMKVLILALFMLGINSLAVGEELALSTKEVVERLIRVEEGQKTLEKGQKVLEEGQKVLEKGQRELSDRLIKVEEGQKELSARLTKVEEGQKELASELTKVKEGQIKIEGGQEALLVKFDEWQKGINKRIDDLKDLIYVLLAGILALIGFVLWDRRSTISPMIKKTKELDERNDLLLKILKEYAIKEPKMAEVLKSLGFL